jgi:hypothetical protein
MPTLHESSLGWMNYNINNRVKSYGGHFCENLEIKIKKARYISVCCILERPAEEHF